MTRNTILTATLAGLLATACAPSAEPCGNGACVVAAGETCSTCPSDCGGCAACGDGSCRGGETCTTCPGDCGSCGTDAGPADGGGGGPITCRNATSCVEFATGWSTSSAMANCDVTMGNTFTTGTPCPTGQRAHCRVIGADGSVAVVNYFAPLTPSITAPHCAALTMGTFTAFYTSDEPTFTCDDSDEGFCSEFVSGYSESAAMGSCNTLASTFSAGSVCPSGRIAHCTVTSPEGTENVVSFYSAITIDYARMTCDAYAPSGSGYTAVFAEP